MEGAADDFVEAGERPPDPLGLQVLLHILPTHQRPDVNKYGTCIPKSFPPLI